MNLISMALTEKTKFRVTIGTMLALIVAVATGAWSVSEDRSTIINAVQANSTRIGNIEQAVVNLANRVETMDKNGTTKGQPTYPAIDAIRAELQAQRSKSDRLEANMEWVVKSLERLQASQGITPPPRRSEE